MKSFTMALLSSLQGLSIDPEDPIGKRIMARVSEKCLRSYLNVNFYISLKHLHTVLHDHGNSEIAIPTELDFDTDESSTDKIDEMMTSGKDN